MTAVVVILFGLAVMLTGCFGGAQDAAETGSGETDSAESAAGSGLLASVEDVGLYDTDGAGVNYAFSYDGEEFYARYYYDNWTIFDSYKIENEDDMVTICQALIDTHTVHGSDMVSFRTAEDMAYEWQQHNLACKYLSEDSSWRSSVENVDLDPADQGRSLKEIYEDRTGEEFDLVKILNDKITD